MSLSDEVIKFINRGWDITFLGNDKTSQGEVFCRIEKHPFIGDGHSDSPLKALQNAIYDVHEEDDDDL